MNQTAIEYVWLGNNPDTVVDIRSKTRVVYGSVDMPALWNYDGSSTNQAPGDDSEVVIRPVKTFKDCFRRPEKDLIVLCDNMKLDKETGELKPLSSNARALAMQVFKEAKNENPRFGIEQELFLMDNETGKPVGFLSQTEEQGNFYCGTCGQFVSGKLREYYEKFLENCRIAGVRLSGANLEVAVGQLEFQVDNYGVDCADDLWMARYIAMRTAQEFNCHIEFSTRVLDGDWNGSGCHTNFSVNSMMAENGWDFTKVVLDRMSENAMKHLERYGCGNVSRLSGKHETAPWSKFSWGVASRADSVRVPTDTFLNKRGYIEDRRPSSCMNPYLVTGLLTQTALKLCPDIEFEKDAFICQETMTEKGLTRAKSRKNAQ